MRKTMRYLVAAAALAAAMPGGRAVCQEGAAPQKKTLQIEGSTTVGPIAEAFREAFEKLHPGVKLTLNASGSGNGIAALLDGRCDIAMASRFMTDGEFKKAVEKGVLPVAHCIALDGVCVIVHATNPLKALTIDQVRDIYTGKIDNWKALGGPDQKIVAYTRETSSGTYECFQEKVMGAQKIAPSVLGVAGNPEMYQRVKATPAGVGYVGLGFVQEGVKALTINGVEPSRKTILSGQYPLARPLFLFTNGYPPMGSLVYGFCTFYLTKQGADLVEDKGFVALTDY